jgi:hypothetical protein
MENLPIFQDLIHTTAKVNLEKLKDINKEQYTHILNESKKLLIIMFRQYKGDWALMSQNIQKYQVFLLKQLREK